MMATLSLRDRERLAKLVYFISIRDEKRVARALNELMESEDTIPAEDLEPQMSAIINEYGDVSAGELRLAGMLFAMMRAIMTHGGRLRPQIAVGHKKYRHPGGNCRLASCRFQFDGTR